MTSMIKVPAYFFDDHDTGRELPTPRVISRTSRTVTISANDTNLAELLSDAEHYAHDDGACAGQSEYAGLKRSAEATVRAINKVIIC